jgi:hypothetical protein
MKVTKLTIIGASLVGSLLIYCGQQTIQTTLDGGSSSVGDARAGAAPCCGKPTFGKVAEGTLQYTASDNKKAYTDLLDVSAYRQLVVYFKDGGNGCSKLNLAFSPDSALSTKFASYSYGNYIKSGTAYPVVGPVVRLYLAAECDGVDYYLLGIN